jgi:hypothetical protein
MYVQKVMAASRHKFQAQTGQEFSQYNLAEQTLEVSTPKH